MASQERALPILRPGAKILLAAEAVIFILLARIVVKFIPLKTMAAGIEKLARRNEAAPSPLLVKQLNWALDAAARRVPVRALCYERGLAAFAMLSLRRFPARLHYGVRTTDGKLDAHVWIKTRQVEVTGCENAHEFKEIFQVPRDPDRQGPVH